MELFITFTKFLLILSTSGRHAVFRKRNYANGFAMKTDVLRKLHSSRIRCALLCYQERECVSYCYNSFSRTCQTQSSVYNGHEDVYQEKGWQYFEIQRFGRRGLESSNHTIKSSQKRYDVTTNGSSDNVTSDPLSPAKTTSLPSLYSTLTSGRTTKTRVLSSSTERPQNQTKTKHSEEEEKRRTLLPDTTQTIPSNTNRKADKETGFSARENISLSSDAGEYSSFQSGGYTGESSEKVEFYDRSRDSFNSLKDPIYNSKTSQEPSKIFKINAKNGVNFNNEELMKVSAAYSEVLNATDTNDKLFDSFSKDIKVIDALDTASKFINISSSRNKIINDSESFHYMLTNPNDLNGILTTNANVEMLTDSDTLSESVNLLDKLSELPDTFSNGDDTPNASVGQAELKDGTHGKDEHIITLERHETTTNINMMSSFKNTLFQKGEYDRKVYPEKTLDQNNHPNKEQSIVVVVDEGELRRGYKECQQCKNNNNYLGITEKETNIPPYKMAASEEMKSLEREKLRLNNNEKRADCFEKQTYKVSDWCSSHPDHPLCISIAEQKQCIGKLNSFLRSAVTPLVVIGILLPVTLIFLWAARDCKLFLTTKCKQNDLRQSLVEV